MGRSRSSETPAKDPGRPGGTVTLHEVARAAGVSVATVSRVINRRVAVSETARRAVVTAVEELGYVPNTAARSLITRRSHMLGVLLPDVHGEFFSELIRGIDVAARSAGYHLLVSSSHSDLVETEEVLRSLHGRVDGLILMTPATDAAAALGRSLPRRVPAVLLNHGGQSPSFDSIRIDNFGGARALVEHLVRLGHRRIAHIRGPEGNQDAAERRRGYFEALGALGLEADAALEVAGEFDEASGHRAGLELARRQPRPRAIFAANDSMAIGCLAALRELGVEVPKEIALAGFDDIPIARYVTPALTSVRVAIAELGERAVARLLGLISRSGAGPHRHELVATELVVRASCGARSSDIHPHQPEGGT